MSYETMGKLMDKWSNDANFREQVRKDPIAAVKQTGLSLTDEEWQTLSNVDWKAPDEELTKRANKLFG